MEKRICVLTTIVGADYVITNSDQITPYKQGTFTNKHANALVVTPKNNEEITSIIAAIHQFNSEQASSKNKAALYTVSSGKNWGYSAQEPSFDNAVLLKLSRIKTIEDYDNKQGTITVSPGVTQQELYDFLQEQGGKFWMDATGASPHCSIIGNTLERGFGHTTYGDHFDKVCNFQIILADGSTINTGFKQFSKNGVTPVASNCYKWGIGPYVDGLFTQSNFGIVTKMTIWLMPKPEHFEAFFISIKNDEKLPALIDAFQPLKLRGLIKSAAHIGNDHKAIQALSFYPWKKSKGQTPLPEIIKEQLKKQYMVSSWSVS